MIPRVLVAALALAAAACQPVPHPFADIAKMPTTPALRPPDSAGIVVLPVAGAPQPIAERLGAAFAEALRNADVPASDVSMNRDSYRLVASTVVTDLDPGHVAVTVVWALSSAEGRTLGSGTVRRDVASGAWQAGDDGLDAAIAGEAAPQIAALVAGDAPLPAGEVAALVALSTVNGAPGDGDATLASAIGTALGRAGVDVAADGAKARYGLSCRVEVAPPANGKQQVTVRWVLSAANGSEVGQVSQQNTVPAGTLDGKWGGVAYAVAAAAAPGIADLIAKAQQVSAGG